MNTQPVVSATTEYLYGQAAAAGIPLSGTFELTPVCNMDCKMCYVRLSHREQAAIAPLATAQQWLTLGRQARDRGMLYLLLTGGEPFLHPQFRQIMEGLHQMGLVITLNSNGTLIDAATVRWLKACPPVRINISLYGTSDHTYRKLCGNPKGFTQVCRAIDLLQKAGICVKLNCSLTPYNVKELPQMVQFAKEKGLMLQVASYMFPPARKEGAAVEQGTRLSPQEAAYYMAYADYLTLGAERFLTQEAQIAVPQYPEELCGAAGEGVSCRAGKCSFWITWQGAMLPCGMLPMAESPNVFTTPFDAAWEQVKEATAAIRLPAQCAQCSAKTTCRACAAMVMAESGSFEKVPQYRCHMTQAYQAQWLRVKEEMLR